MVCVRIMGHVAKFWTLALLATCWSSSLMVEADLHCQFQGGVSPDRYFCKYKPNDASLFENLRVNTILDVKKFDDFPRNTYRKYYFTHKKTFVLFSPLQFEAIFPRYTQFVFDYHRNFTTPQEIEWRPKSCRYFDEWRRRCCPWWELCYLQLLLARLDTSRAWAVSDRPR